MSVFKLPGTAIQANTITTTQLQTTVVTQIQSGASGGPKVKSLIYPGNDTAANTVGGQTLYITGSGFAANAQVLVNGAAVPSQSFISASNISFTTPALSTGTYPVYVINPEDGGTAILYPGLLISGEPSWVSSASLSSSQDELGSWSYSLSATGDTPITYALAAGNTLPTGITLAANGLISGTLSSPSGNTTTYTFSVIATDAQNQDSTRQFTVTTTTGEGILFANNTLLIHADGSNNGNNHAFLDSSNNNLTITRGGNATQGSFSPFSQTGWSAYFDGNGDYLQISHNTALDLGSGDFTIEFWMNTPSWSSGTGALIGKKLDDTTSGWQLYRDANYPTKINARLGAQNNFLTNSSVTTNVWEHWALVRTGSTIYWFKNGVLDNTGTSSTNLVDTSASLNIGFANTWSVYGTFYISNLRIVKGTALYTSGFTPSTTPLTAVANTQLLTCQSNRFKDNSNNNFSITRNGDTSIQAFSPFAPTASYSTSNVGGSVYLDGNDDYLSISDNAALELGSGDFTLEAWCYITTSGTEAAIFGKWTIPSLSSFILEKDTSNKLSFLVSSAGSSFDTYTSGNTIPINAWSHVAAVRTGNTLKLFINGVQELSTAYTTTPYDSSSALYIGCYRNDSTSAYVGDFPGYISGARIVKGTAVYTAAFTPPTAPVTNIANTSLLLNFTNAQIFDQTAKQNFECIGDTKVTTSVYKYGTGSISFDGTGDWLKITRTPLLDFGTGDFTVECWVRFNTVSIDQGILAGGGVTGGYDILYRTGIGLVIGRYNTAFDNTFSWSPSINTWYHIAWCRSGSSLRAFVDGTQIGSTASNSIEYNGGTSFNSIGTSDNGSNRLLNGYLDDVRITKGYARYTSNFTPPTSAMKDK